MLLRVEFFVILIERVIGEMHVGIVVALGVVILLTGQSDETIIEQEYCHWAKDGCD